MTDTTEIDLDKLQAYVDAEREKAERAKRAETRAYMDGLLAEIEEKRLASQKADRERRDAGDPNLQAAKMLQEALGDQWDPFMQLMRRANLTKLAASLGRLDRERKASAEHGAAQAAPQIRADAQAVTETRIATEIEAQLLAAGLMRDVTEETDV